MPGKIYILKFYATNEDFVNKNPFYKTEFVGTELQAKEKADQLKEELHAAAYKIKVRDIQ